MPTPAGVGPLTVLIEQIQPEAMLVDQPSAAGSARTLARFGVYRMECTGPDGPVTGTVRVLGRARMPAGDGGTLYGYRLAMPESLRRIDRRADPRIDLAGVPALRARLRVSGIEIDLVGRAEDLSAGGASIRCPIAPLGLATGTPARIEICAPAPIGRLDEPCTIMGVVPTAEGDAMVVRIAFRTRQQRIAALTEPAAGRRSA